MSHLVTITLLRAHSIARVIEPKGAECTIHKGVADDLIKRKIAKLTKPAKDEHPKRDIKSGE